MMAKSRRAKAVSKADAEFSRWVRRTAADKSGWAACITCEKKYEWNKLHNGHFMSRRHTNTRWEVKNTSPQCSGCNTFRGGEQFIFGQKLDKKFGAGTAELMLIESRKTTNLTVDDIEEIALKYQKLNKEIDGRTKST